MLRLHRNIKDGDIDKMNNMRRILFRTHKNYGSLASFGRLPHDTFSDKGHV